MIKKLGLTTIVSALLIVGCGGGGSSSTSDTSVDTTDSSTSTEEILTRNTLGIYKNSPPEICDPALWPTADSGFADFLVTPVSTGTTCATYESIDPNVVCLELDYAELYAQVGEAVPENAITCLVAYNADF